eukprot:scaffold52191_cov21-Tisochrysis_lutea.AAC.2
MGPFGGGTEDVRCNVCVWYHVRMHNAAALMSLMRRCGSAPLPLTVYCSLQSSLELLPTNIGTLIACPTERFQRTGFMCFVFVAGTSGPLGMGVSDAGVLYTALIPGTFWPRTQP